MMTDIHFGRKNNSEVHNQDCINYIKWFCEQVENDEEIDGVFFLGDWHEHRSAINGLTLHYSELGANMLNSLNKKIWFCIGNHDLYFRNTRDIFTTVIFDKLENFTIVNEPIVLKDNSCVIAPFLFEEEYDEFFKKYKEYDVIAGHFEFKGFVLTGETFVKEDGPDPSKYSKQKKIFSGHYHKRQSKHNVHYIGNTFPADFSDANDLERGMAVYDFRTDDVKYINWPECPKYIKTKLSDVLKNPSKVLDENARVKVVVDQEISLSENNEIKKLLTEKYGLREMVLEEQVSTEVELTDIEQEIEDLKLTDLSDIVPELLKRIKSDKIDSTKLVEIYRKL